MLQVYRGVAGAALLGLTLAPVVALAEDASATSPQGLISFLPAPGRPGQSVNAAKDVNVASLPSDGVAVAPPPLPAISGFYIETHASWQHVDLPRVNLGMANLGDPAAASPFPYASPTVSNTFVATGVGGDLAVGYHLPPGMLSPAFGAAPRVELDFSIVDASQTQNTSVVPQVPFGSGTIGMMLNGIPVNDGPDCNVPGFLSCVVNSSASSHYQDWHLGLKGATDFQFGMITASPSLSLIGGEGQNDIRVAQSLQQVVIGLGIPGIAQDYAARVNLHSDDIGGKLGLNLKLPIASGLTAALGGSVALVDRDTSLRGSDFFVSNVPGLIPSPPQPSPFLTSISSNKNTAAFLSNVEGSLNFQIMPAVSLRIFGGMNYDNSVPGVKAPVFFGGLFAPTGGTPARITFVSEISYYGGAGFVVHF